MSTSPETLADIRAAQRGDIDARNRVVLANLGLIGNMLKRISFRNPITLEELESVGHEALIKAVSGFDATKGFAFSTYASAAIHQDIRKYLRRHGARGFYLPVQPVKEKQTASPCVVTDVDFGRVAVEYSKEDVDAVDILEVLDDRERTVIYRRFWQGERLREIGRVIGLTKERVRQIQEIALNKMRRAVA